MVWGRAGSYSSGPVSNPCWEGFEEVGGVFFTRASDRDGGGSASGPVVHKGGLVHFEITLDTFAVRVVREFPSSPNLLWA